MRKQRNICSPKQLLAVIISILLFGSLAWGLDPDKPVNQYLVDHWEMADGIPANEVRSITQTPDGYLWIATSNGLVRFDGIKFSIIPFVEKEKIDPRKTIDPVTLLVDKQEMLWIGSSGVLTSYNYQTGQFKTYTSEDGLTDDRIRRIKDDMNGNLWISFFSSYVNRFADGEFTAFNSSHGLLGKKIDVIFEDRKGNLLFGSREKGVFIYKDGKFSSYPLPGVDNYQIAAMCEDEKGNLWIGTNNGLFKVNDKGTARYTIGDGLTSDIIISIIKDSDGNLWIGTMKGLNRLKKKQDGTVVIENLPKPLFTCCLFEDKEKNLWIGTVEAGIKQLKDAKFISYAPLEKHPAEVLLSVFEDRTGDIRIGTFTGKLFHCRGGEIVELLEPSELSGTGITAIAEDVEGNLWLGTNGKGIFQKKKDTYIRLTTREGLADNQVTSIYRDSWGNLWFCTFDGVSVRFYPNGIIKSFTSRDGILGKRVHNVYEDKNKNIWIASDQGITVLKDGKIAKQNAKFYLQGISIPCIYEDLSASDGEGQIFWISTRGAGLKRLNLKNGTITSYTTAIGMTTNIIYQFFADQQGNFWLMSNNGILRLSITELNHFANGEVNTINCISYGVSDGMKSPEFNNERSRHSALQTRDGELWFITKKGISIVDPEKIPINKIPPPVVIEAIFFDDESIPLHQEEQVFRGIRDFTFHFTAPTFQSPGKIIFKYQLEGFDREWVFLLPGKERVAHYQDLGPGTYTFKVTACNADGVWNQTGFSFKFTLKPPFYETILFKIAVFLLFAGFLVAAVYIYKKRPFDKKKKYKDSPLNPQFAEVCIKRLNYLLESEKIYLDEDISLQSLAKKISIPSHQLSQLLNEKLKQSFFDLINSYRIEEAKKILTGPKGAEKKNTAVAYDVGFNSMTAFYKAFKKFTGMTPNQYKKEIKKKKKSPPDFSHEDTVKHEGTRRKTADDR
ncbi:MAG: helix-turn-helix domain-containing protein [Candidatus Aminicenantes bacterium]|nr:MAG: helix-turn-helix domain-containing protein [Candidatus Aminicenantes bacterium]